MTLPELQDRLRDIFEDRREKTMFIMGAGTAAPVSGSSAPNMTLPISTERMPAWR